MKKRTLLLGTPSRPGGPGGGGSAGGGGTGSCGNPCKDKANMKKAWDTIGKFLRLANQLFGPVNSPQKDDWLAGILQAAATANPCIPPGIDSFKDARDAYDAIGAACGFKSDFK